MKSVSIQMDELLDEFNNDLQNAVDQAGLQTAREAAKKLRATSPKGRKTKESGRYAKGWAYKRQDGGYIVYNKTTWQLTHLLENGHRIVNRFGEFGRVNGRKHIEPVEQWANEEFPIRISRGLK